MTSDLRFPSSAFVLSLYSLPHQRAQQLTGRGGASEEVTQLEQDQHTVT